MSNQLEINNQLGLIALLDARDGMDAEEIRKIQDQNHDVEEDMMLMEFLIEKLHESKKAADQKGDKHLEIGEDLQEGIRKFREETWGRIQGRHQGSIPDHRHPFPDYVTLDTITPDEALSISNRLLGLNDGETKILRESVEGMASLTHNATIRTQIGVLGAKQNDSRHIVQQTGR